MCTSRSPIYIIRFTAQWFHAFFCKLRSKTIKQTKGAVGNLSYASFFSFLISKSSIVYPDPWFVTGHLIIRLGQIEVGSWLRDPNPRPWSQRWSSRLGVCRRKDQGFGSQVCRSLVVYRGQFAVTRLVSAPDQVWPYEVLFHSKFHGQACRSLLPSPVPCNGP